MLILDNEISRARFAVHYETPYSRLFWITKLLGLDSLSIMSLTSRRQHDIFSGLRIILMDAHLG